MTDGAKAHESLFYLRPAEPQDADVVAALLAAEGMDPIEDLVETTTVAADDCNEPIGFIRIVVENDDPYIYPVVIAHKWRGSGVGRALVDFSTVVHGALKLVSRGASCGFYEHLGFKAIDWEEISPDVRGDCDRCEMYLECEPRPYMRAMDQDG